jgi:hypothetical protein
LPTEVVSRALSAVASATQLAGPLSEQLRRSSAQATVRRRRTTAQLRLGSIVVMIVVVVNEGWWILGRLARGIWVAATMIAINASTDTNTTIVRRPEIARSSSFGTLATLGGGLTYG